MSVKIAAADEHPYRRMFWGSNVLADAVKLAFGGEVREAPRECSSRVLTITACGIAAEDHAAAPMLNGGASDNFGAALGRNTIPNVLAQTIAHEGHGVRRRQHDADETEARHRQVRRSLGR